nr:SGNH/GDSL hydrolase family protein [Planctomycetota bacterium]
ATDAVASDDLGWHEPTTAPFALNGFPWFAVDHIYRRMPVSPAHPLPEAVDGLANHTAGGQIRFRTDARDISVRVDLRGVADMHHMPSTGQCGFDCYVGAAGSQRYAGSSIYDQRKQSYQARVFESSARELRDVTLYFPLYQGVDTVWIGLDRDAALAPPQPWRMSRPVVIYGTSITQGGCAARPGMAYTNILSRRLQAEVINLGFSGSGRGEPEVARVIAGIPDPACLVLDFEANCQDVALFESRLAPFIGILRAAHPTVPILVLPKPPYAWDPVRPTEIRSRDVRHAHARKVVDELRTRGDSRVYFHDIAAALADTAYHEGTVDGAHPTDLGFQLLADAIEPGLRRALGL